MRKEGGLVFLTAGEMAEADRIAIEETGIDVLSLMENAGAATARVARMMLGGRVTGKKVHFLVGKGNNGGDALVAARHIRNWGGDSVVALGGEKSELREVPARQLDSVVKMGVPVGGPETQHDRAQLLVDGLLGYGSKGDPREPVKGMILKANQSGVPTLAVDLPSGLDSSSGAPGDPCIVARTTVTFGLPKTGFLNLGSRRFVGELYLADISLPDSVYRRFSADPGLFERDTLVRVW